jgi:PhnB protein
MSIIPNYVPQPYKTLNAQLVVKDAHKALEFYNRAFGAETTMKLVDPNGVVVHAEMKIVDTVIMLSEENPKINLAPESLGATSVVLQLYVDDVETFVEEAVSAGAKVVFPIRNQFYGDRAGRIKDPFGHDWIIATHTEDLTASQIQERFNQLYF